MVKRKATGNAEIVTDSVQFKDYKGLHQARVFKKRS